MVQTLYRVVLVLYHLLQVNYLFLLGITGTVLLYCCFTTLEQDSDFANLLLNLLLNRNTPNHTQSIYFCSGFLELPQVRIFWTYYLGPSILGAIGSQSANLLAQVTDH